MLKYIKIENYLSFKDEVEINFESTNYGNKKSNVFNIKSGRGQHTLSKSMLVYGANASGKTNIIRAVVAIKRFVTNSIGSTVLEGFLLDSENQNKPSFFEVCFLIGKKEFIYNFELHLGIIKSENLFEIKNNEKIELISRNYQNINLSNYLEKYNDKISTIKNTVSVLWMLDQFDCKLSGEGILSFFHKIHSFGNGIPSPDLTIELLDLLKSEDNKNFVLEILKSADIDICDIKIEEENRTVVQFNALKKVEEFQEKGAVIRFGHKVKGSNEIKYFNLGNESTGTQKLFMILGPIVATIKNEGILLFDEIESGFHPHIVKNIFNLIHSNINDKKYQFFFTTHNVELMDLTIFKKEQIGITNKDKFGATDFYTLYDFEDLRTENDVKKYYNAGMFGGVPMISDFSELIKDFTQQGENLEN